MHNEDTCTAKSGVRVCLVELTPAS